MSSVAEKRPLRFFRQWLVAPEVLNANHRMPVFDLTSQEAEHLATYLGTLGKPTAATGPSTGDVADAAARQRGRELVEQLRCAACHQLPEQGPAVRKTALQRDRLEAPNCLDAAEPDRHPGYSLSAKDRASAVRFLSRLTESSRPPQTPPQQILAENNCLSCHARDGVRGLAARLPAFAEHHNQLAPLIPAMTPPALHQVGDKLHREALKAAILREGKPHRDYLAVRMPRFRIPDDQLDDLTDWFVATDRIPEDAYPTHSPDELLDGFALRSAGRRLVTSDGFGCTSCHQIGSVKPVAAPLNARGPTLSMCGQRIRREWYDRFLANPTRVIPALEMPSVRLAVRGVLDDNLHAQTAAVWRAMNQPGFDPPLPNPVRIVRQTGHDVHGRAEVLTDVVRRAGETVVKPLLVGLANRHSMLFDLESAQLLVWSIGDVARQRTEGKTWFWEVAGETVLEVRRGAPEFGLRLDGETHQPIRVGQFLTELDSLTHTSGELHFSHRLHFGKDTAQATVLRVRQELVPFAGPAATGIRRRVVISGLPTEAELRFSAAPGLDAVASDNGKTLAVDGSRVRLRLRGDDAVTWNDDGTTSVRGNPAGQAVLDVEYVTELPVDTFPVQPQTGSSVAPIDLDIVPGFHVTRLPFVSEVMPTAMAWRPNGDLLIASLKGRVWLARDTTGDGFEDVLVPISDELPAPYGIAATEEHVDVLTKFGLLRLFDRDGDDTIDHTEVVASGWGHTDDYHDWAVGLAQDRAGNYLIALPCQQDDRSPAAAHLRGNILRLIRRTATAEDPRRFALEPVAAGLRFPMGIALRHDGELFVTDNQGNYNPFNELNHIVAGRRYGFINSLERRPDFKPVLTPPAIDIPHPWTRSVNGICFLDSRRTNAPKGHFGPFEGHLIGCEMDTRRLVRMTLQKVDGEFQGAAYPFSYNEPRGGGTWLGPLTCEVAPSGDLYVGGVHDSGWGGGNNIGEIARLRPQLAKLPCGIQEVTAHPDGLRLTFTSRVDPVAAADPANYSISTYTRTSTPAYGGDDQQRRKQQVRKVNVSSTGDEVSLELGELLAGHVYEVFVKNLAPHGAEFFPAEAHYTMRRIPAPSKDD